MESILNKLYFSIAEELDDSLNTDFSEETFASYQAFQKSLNKKQFALFLQYEEFLLQSFCEGRKRFFLAGIKTGAKLAMELFEENPILFNDTKNNQKEN